MGRLVQSPATVPLWKNRGFNILWAGQTISALGNAFTTVAFPILIYQATGKIESMTAITACMAGGAMISGLFSGTVVDRSDRRRLLIWADLLRAVLMAAIPAAGHLHVLSLPLLALVAVAMGCLANLSHVAFVAFLPELVTKAHVSEGNSRLTATGAATYVFGPALAGFATQAWGTQAAIGIDALSFLLSFVVLLFVKVRPTEVTAQPASSRRLSAGLRFLLATPILRAMTLVVCAEMLLTGAALDLFTFHLKSALHQTDAKVGSMFAIASVGAVIGAALSAFVRRRVGIHVTYVASAGILAVAFASLPWARSFVATAAAAVLFALSSTIRDLLSMTRRQELIPDALIGRVTAIVLFAIAATQVLGATLVGLAAKRFGYGLTCELLGGALFVIMLVLIPSRSLRSAG